MPLGRGNSTAKLEMKANALFGELSILLVWSGGTLGNEYEMVHLAQTLKSFTHKAKESVLYSEGF